MQVFVRGKNVVVDSGVDFSIGLSMNSGRVLFMFSVTSIDTGMSIGINTGMGLAGAKA